jgi:hypothetical protein
MIPAEWVCVPVAVILLVIVVMWRIDRGNHKIITMEYKRRMRVEEGWEEE